MITNFLSMVREATLISQLILAFLICMSIGSWAVIFMKYRALYLAKIKTLEGIRNFESANDLRNAVLSISEDADSPLYAITQRGVNEFNTSREAGIQSGIVVHNVMRSLEQGVAYESTRLNSKMSTLATCASTAPFIGLLGTVWGIMHSFHAIGLMKSASLATVAPGISEALIATAVGLFVAIPASMAYNAFSGKIDAIEALLTNFSSSFINRVQRELG